MAIVNTLRIYEALRIGMEDSNARVIADVIENSF